MRRYNSFGTDCLEVFCKVCGKRFKQSYGGRFKEYCSDDCKNYFKFLSALDRSLSKIDFKSDEKLKAVKGDLMRLRNSLPQKVDNAAR